MAGVLPCGGPWPVKCQFCTEEGRHYLGGGIRTCFRHFLAAFGLIGSPLDCRYTMSTTTNKLPTTKGSNLMRWVVLVDGVEAGLIEKFKAEKKTLHPYKAYRGIGEACTLVDFIYDEKEATKLGMALADTDTKGGFDAAVNAVYLAHDLWTKVQLRKA